MHAIVAALQWDPQIRGALIVVVAVILLPGSAFLLLSTNVGARLGTLLGVAGLTGWLSILSVAWIISGQGIVGRPPSWKAQEIVTGPPTSSTIGYLAGLPAQPPTTPDGKLDTKAKLPNGWRVLAPGEAILGDATAAAGKTLAPDTAVPAPGAPPSTPKFTPPFPNAAAYVQIVAYDKGHETYWFTIKHHHFFKNGPWWNPVGWFRHPPHHVVMVVQPTQKTVGTPDPTAKPVPDKSQPYTTLTLARDLGSIRFPPFMMLIGSGLIFAITCNMLHRRDKELMARRAATDAEPPAGARPATA